MYYELWNMLADFIYGTEAVLTSDQTLTMTILCTAGVLFVVSCPFILTWRFIKLFA